MKKIISIYLMFKCFIFSFAQQTPVFSEYHFSPFTINPAYAGLASKQVALTHNGSFIEGAPSTSVLNYSSDINYSKIGYGFVAMNDEIGVTKNTSLYGAFSYRIEFDHINERADWEIYDMNVLSFGLTAGIQLYRENLQELGIDNDINFQQNTNIVIPTIGAGIIYNRANFFIGISSPNLIGTALATDNTVNIVPAFYTYSGFRFYTSKFERFMLKPSILVKMQNGSPLQLDFNIAGVYKQKFEIGFGYRTTSSLSALIGFKLKNGFKIMYSYNTYFNDFIIANNHGIGLSYFFSNR